MPHGAEYDEATQATHVPAGCGARKAVSAWRRCGRSIPARLRGWQTTAVPATTFRTAPRQAGRTTTDS